MPSQSMQARQQLQRWKEQNLVNINIAHAELGTLWWCTRSSTFQVVLHIFDKD